MEAGTTDVEVMLRRVAWIEGIVHDSTGQPAAAITVQGEMPGLAAGFRSPKVRTGSDGRFRLRVGEGDIVQIHAGPPPENDFPPDTILKPHPDHMVVIPGIAAGTTGLVITLR